MEHGAREIERCNKEFRKATRPTDAEETATEKLQGGAKACLPMESDREEEAEQKQLDTENIGRKPKIVTIETQPNKQQYCMILIKIREKEINQKEAPTKQSQEEENTITKNQESSKKKNN